MLKGLKVIAVSTSEKKTKRVQLLLRPSLYRKVKAYASITGVSVNEFIHSVLESVID